MEQDLHGLSIQQFKSLIFQLKRWRLVYLVLSKRSEAGVPHWDMQEPGTCYDASALLHPSFASSFLSQIMCTNNWKPQTLDSLESKEIWAEIMIITDYQFLSLLCSSILSLLLLSIANLSFVLWTTRAKSMALAGRPCSVSLSNWKNH